MHQAPSSRDKGFKGLLAWKAADLLAQTTYLKLRPMRQKDPHLFGQATRAAISVPANIAEGYGRGGLGDYLRFLDIARGSLSELEYYFHFIEELGIIGKDEIAELNSRREEAGRLLTGLWRATKAKSRSDWDHNGPELQASIREVAEFSYS